MDSGTEKIHYQFESFKDLTKKANPFIRYLEQLEESSRKLHLLTENELSSNEGLIIDKAEEKIHYQFESFKDLTKKANPFIRYLEQLEESSRKLHLLTENELSSNEGLIIDKAEEKIRERTEYQQLYYETCKSSMKNMAAKYTDIVDDMNFQKITLHYDIIKND